MRAFLAAGTTLRIPILAAVIVIEIDGIERFPSDQKLCGYAGLCPSTHIKRPGTGTSWKSYLA